MNHGTNTINALQMTKFALTFYLISYSFLGLGWDAGAPADHKPDSTKTIVVLDYETKLPIAAAWIGNANGPAAKTNIAGAAEIFVARDISVKASKVGFHDVMMQGTELNEVDTLYMFGCTLMLKEKGETFRKSKYIKRNRIYLEQHNLKYSYSYNPTTRQLTLRVESAHQ